MPKPASKRIAVGMSGGVDSAVSALLLVQQGYEVIGVFMQNWDDALNNDVRGNPRKKGGVIDGPCPVEDDYQSALQAARAIGIPLHRIDFIHEYWRDVFANFVAEYKAGRTPNPDILCNKHIKFAAFAQAVRERFGCEAIAMGHYARTTRDKDGVHLLRGVDEGKDQSYFLAQLSQEQLGRAVFPIGHLRKTEVRELARKHGLPNADRKDSTGICFIGERDFKEFLQNYIPALPGDVVDVTTNRKVGEHIGVMYYTIGQRRGLGLGGNEERYFVAGRDIAGRRLLVATASREAEFLTSTRCLVGGLNWVCRPPEQGGSYTAKFRYRQRDVPVTVTLDGTEMTVAYPQGVKAVAPGQQLVLYDGAQCLGGGVIEQVL